MGEMPAIDVKDITKHFHNICAVDRLSLTIMPGEIFGFLGPNGSGKTTAIRMLCGLLTPDSGEGQCLGYNIITQSLEIKEHTGYMPQKFSLYEDLTVKENLTFMGQMYSLPDLKEVVNHTLFEFNLKERQNQLAGSLSGGWKQRLSLAACLMHNPKLLLLDEPTAGVDPFARKQFWDIIIEGSKKNITALVSTHYTDEAERCDRLAYIAWGHLIEVGTPQELIQKYHTRTLEEVFVQLMSRVASETKEREI